MPPHEHRNRSRNAAGDIPLLDSRSREEPERAGIENPTTVDLVTQAPSGEVRLIMVDSRPWHSEPGQRRRLLDKINAYST